MSVRVLFLPGKLALPVTAKLAMAQSLPRRLACVTSLQAPWSADRLRLITSCGCVASPPTTACRSWLSCCAKSRSNRVGTAALGCPVERSSTHRPSALILRWQSAVDRCPDFLRQLFAAAEFCRLNRLVKNYRDYTWLD